MFICELACTLLLAGQRQTALAKQAQLLSERARRDAVKLERAAAHAQKLAARAHVRRLYEIRRAHEASARGHPLVRRPRSASPEKRLALLRAYEDENAESGAAARQ